ncbi:LysM peptidoglycan-binding domain-containing protein [Rhodomicrobium vannielii ATCC 17100]|uniref:LysM peptidoglycan-binding domain-containing protein n=1 Tax=Rhodomicrobium vannielii TaxID=1069 RepID=UPI001919F74D|nr:LysM domain-containing protein [Rhodomicrobium vannielii]MBJ7532768.1 LysM peptidoglycan-binding domain-containing protein [Rhodomicrobium vannielii ATCC 17100]
MPMPILSRSSVFGSDDFDSNSDSDIALSQKAALFKEKLESAEAAGRRGANVNTTATGDVPLPTRKPCTTQAKRGDTLWGLAQRHNTTVRELRKLNPGLKPRQIQVDQPIKLPQTECRPASTEPGLTKSEAGKSDTSVVSQDNAPKKAPVSASVPEETSTIERNVVAPQENAPPTSETPSPLSENRSDEPSAAEKLRKDYLVAPENQEQPKTALGPKGETGGLSGQQIAHGETHGIIFAPNLTGWGPQTIYTPPIPTSIMAGQHYGSTFETPQAATRYAQEGLERSWFGASDRAAIVKERDGYSVYGTQLGSRFSVHAQPADKADENFKALTPHPDLTALVSKEGVVADYRSGKAQIENTKPVSNVSLATKAVRYLNSLLDSNGNAPAPSSAEGANHKSVQNELSRVIDRIENATNKTMPEGSQFSWAVTGQFQVGSKEVQGRLRTLLTSAAAEMGAEGGFNLGKGQWKGVTTAGGAILGGATGYTAGKVLIPSDLQFRVDAEGRKSNVLFLNTNVDAGTVLFGLINNMGGAAQSQVFVNKPGQADAKGDSLKNLYDLGANHPAARSGALVTLDTALKGVDYQHTSAIGLLGQALYNGLSTEVNLEVSYARPKDDGAPGQQASAAARLTPEETKVWLSVSFAAVSEGSTYGQASAKNPGWQPLKDKVSVTVQVPIDTKKIDKATLADLTSGDTNRKIGAALTVATRNLDKIPFATAFDAALVASGLRSDGRIEDMIEPGMIASVNTEYSTSHKLPLNLSGSPIFESKITAGMTKDGQRLKYLGLKVTGQISYDLPTGQLVKASVAIRPGIQVNIPLPIDDKGRVSAQRIGDDLDAMIAKMRTAQTAPTGQPAADVDLLETHPYSSQLRGLRASVLDSRTETGHWTAEERQAVAEKWRQAVDLANALEN